MRGSSGLVCIFMNDTVAPFSAEDAERFGRALIAEARIVRRQNKKREKEIARERTRG